MFWAPMIVMGIGTTGHFRTETLKRYAPRRPGIPFFYAQRPPLFARLPSSLPQRNNQLDLSHSGAEAGGNIRGSKALACQPEYAQIQ